MDDWIDSTAIPRQSRFDALRAATITSVVMLLATALAAPAIAKEFGFEQVVSKARAMAGTAYQEPDGLPDVLANLTYDHYRDIRFSPDRSIWRGNDLKFELQMFHPGFYFETPVRINLVGPDQVRQVHYDSGLFDFGRLNESLDAGSLGNLSFAGFRVHFDSDPEAYKDEILVFQGASYFRAIGSDQHYGLSARGLAVDTGLTSGEEFPAFREFWIVRPQEDAERLKIYALLDSPSIAGAYQFELVPGETTKLNVRSHVFARKDIQKLGVAPLTSMFLFGENQPGPVHDYRPEVHDSDGLMIHASDGEWLWRPLRNPSELTINSFSTTNPIGFGLMQRDRTWSHYEDLEARYQDRPSAWVEPEGNWGDGHVELVLIPTPDETNDNIVAYWVPADEIKAGDSLEFSYRLSWQKKMQTTPPGAWALQSRAGHGWIEEQDDSKRLLIDFAGPSLDALPEDAIPESNVWLDANGELIEQQVIRNPMRNGWRLSFRFRAKDPQQPIEMRAHLSHEDETLTETWSYLLTP